MNPLRLARTAAVLAAAVAALPAIAVEGGAGALYDRGSWPTEVVRRPLTLPSTMLELELPFVLDVSQGSDFQPFFFLPAVALGVTDDVTIRVYEPENGQGICLSGTSGGCIPDWHDLGAEVLVSLSRHQHQQFVTRAGAEGVRWGDRTLVTARAGLAYKATMGNLAVAAGADLRIGITERDTVNDRETATFWAEPQVQLSPTAALVLGIGAFFDLQPRRHPWMHATPSIGDTLRVPFSAALQAQVSSRVGLGLALRFPDLLGPGGTADRRLLMVFADLFL